MQVTGILSLVLLLFAVTLTGVLVWFRHTFTIMKSLGLFSPCFLLVSVLPHLQPAVLNTNEQGRHVFPCDVYFFGQLLMLPFLCHALIAQMCHIERYCQLFGLRKVLLTSQDAQQKQLIATRMTAIHKSLHWSRFLLAFLTSLIPMFLVATLVYTLTPARGREVDECYLDGALRVTHLAVTVVYLLLVVAVRIVYFSKKTIPTHVKAIYTGAIAYLSLCYLIETILFWVARDSSFDASLFGVLAYLVVLYKTLLEPALSTFESWHISYTSSSRVANNERAKKAAQTLTIHDLLGTTMGFKYLLLFARSQFCDESLIAWRSIDQFQRKSSLEHMKDIFHNCIEAGSPVEINISYEMRRRVKTKIDEILSSSNVTTQQLQTVFDEVKAELEKLMTQQLLTGIKESVYFERYLNNEPVEEEDDSEGVSSLHTKQAISLTVSSPSKNLISSPGSLKVVIKEEGKRSSIIVPRLNTLIQETEFGA